MLGLGAINYCQIRPTRIHFSDPSKHEAGTVSERKKRVATTDFFKEIKQ
jgi:hypothetical protein